MKYFSILAVALLLALPVLAHGSHDMQGSAPQISTINDSASVAYQEAHNSGTLADFPRLHPLVVHFPIVFLILAFIIQIVSFFVFKTARLQGGKVLSWITLFLIALGFIGAYIAANIFHGGDPDLSTLSTIARDTFEKHEQFANYTVWISGIAAIVKIISHFVFKRKLWTEIIAVILMAGAVYTITITGDMGARLVHIDAIGVQGNKIPLHDTD